MHHFKLTASKAIFALAILSGLSFFSIESKAEPTSKCTALGSLYSKNGKLLISFSKLRPFTKERPSIICKQVLEGMKSKGAFLTASNEPPRLCLTIKAGEPCIEDVVVFESNVDPNKALQVLIGTNKNVVRLETSAQLYLRPSAEL